ncbi:Trp biosynthesis-associated membrane protein [Aeromicrobium sp. UC242_57]|uniref:Trp biosynthesis-associated membrane protein n=1 Tax=Aeromicrobium sp. UC242_57 TaxID=3374624 RepID=UPI0037A03ED1
MSPRRLYGPVVLATLAVGGLAFFAASRAWATTTLSSDGLPPTDLQVTGTDAEPLVSALALVVVTAALAVLAAGPRLRRVVGVLLILVAGLAIVVAPRPGSGGIDRAVSSAAEESPAFTGPESIGAISSTPWYFVAVLAFVLAVLLGAAIVRWAPSWPTMSSRYDAPGAAPRAAEPTSGTDLWKAMDEGRDPTE